MAQVATTQPPVITASRLRRTRAVAIVVALFATGILALAILGGSSLSTGSHIAHRQALAPGTRFDGGPDEGTRGAVIRPAPSRFDGGPDEGTRGVR